MRAILAIDPGKHTGIAWAVLDDHADTVKDAMLHRLHDGSVTIEGDEWGQIKCLYSLWVEFKKSAVNEWLLDPKQVDLVIEDFSLEPGAHAGGKEGISPVRIAWGFEGYRLGHGDRWRGSKHVTPTTWQLPSAMKYKAQLRSWGCWVRGKEHERSAWCHVGARMMRVIR